VIPQITLTVRFTEVSLLVVMCVFFEVAFIDSLGSVDMTFEWVHQF